MTVIKNTIGHARNRSLVLKDCAGDTLSVEYNARLFRGVDIVCEQEGSTGGVAIVALAPEDIRVLVEGLEVILSEIEG